MSIAFLELELSEEVIAIDPKKVEKICNLPAPTDKGGVRSILGFGNYYLLGLGNCFIKSYYLIITAPLQELLKKSVHFTWTDKQEKHLTCLNMHCAKLRCSHIMISMYHTSWIRILET